jgi:hypothetical protein
MSLVLFGSKSEGMPSCFVGRSYHAAIVSCAVILSKTMDDRVQIAALVLEVEIEWYEYDKAGLRVRQRFASYHATSYVKESVSFHLFADWSRVNSGSSIYAIIFG